jgi:SNF2 family DNA or RNA helicase
MDTVTMTDTECIVIAEPE